MKVRATQRGQFGHVREIGDEFEVPEGLTGSWFVPVEAAPEPAEDATARRGPGRPPKS